MDRWKELQKKRKAGVEENLLQVQKESRGQITHKDTSRAESALLKLEVEAEGGDFERKQAWDYTVEESESWDARQAKKSRARDNVAFQDYTSNASKVYKRQRRNIQPDTDTYTQSKQAAIDRAAASGQLEIVEIDDELVAVDKDGTFYSTADSTDFLENKPDRAAVDRLVADLRKAEETRLRKRKQQGKDDDEGDVTYINDQNAKFNKKLARFYNKYTSDIRDSFERGTMI